MMRHYIFYFRFPNRSHYPNNYEANRLSRQFSYLENFITVKIDITTIKIAIKCNLLLNTNFESVKKQYLHQYIHC